MLSGVGSYIEKDGKKLYLTREGKRDVVSFTIYKKESQANEVTMKGLQLEAAKVKKDMKMMRMGPVPGTADQKKEFTEEE